MKNNQLNIGVMVESLIYSTTGFFLILVPYGGVENAFASALLSPNLWLAKMAIAILCSLLVSDKGVLRAAFLIVPGVVMSIQHLTDSAAVPCIGMIVCGFLILHLYNKKNGQIENP